MLLAAALSLWEYADGSDEFTYITSGAIIMFQL